MERVLGAVIGLVIVSHHPPECFVNLSFIPSLYFARSFIICIIIAASQELAWIVPIIIIHSRFDESCDGSDH